MNYRILCWVLPFIMLFSASSVFSAGSDSDDSSSSADTLDVNYLKGKEQVANQDYQAAIRYLLKAVETDPENADVYNLLGYSHRNLEMNDKAFVYYEKALSLDPRHKGAHEYIGELYLKMKQPEKAKEHLAKLDSICFFGCEEFDELKEAIQDYEKITETKVYYPQKISGGVSHLSDNPLPSQTSSLNLPSR